jgi:DNA polymerase I
VIKFITSAPYTRINIQRGTLDEIRQWSVGRKSVNCDSETTGLHPLLHKMLLLIIGDKDIQFVIDLRTTPKAEVIRLLEDLKHLKFIFHNSKFDYSFIKAHYGVELRNLYCTYLASQILMNGLEFEHSLENLLRTGFGVQLKKQQRKSFIKKPDMEPFTQEEIEYAADDIQYLRDLAEMQMNHLRLRDQNFLINLENKVTPVIANIELKGIDLDIAKWRSIAENNKSRAFKVELLMDREIKRLSKRHQGLVGGNYTRKRVKAEIIQTDLFGGTEVVKENLNKGNINYSSSDQVLEIFSRCGVSLQGASEDHLLVFLKNNPNTELKKFCDFLLYYKKIKKRLSTYGESFLSFINPVTGRIHTNFTQCYTDTGRFSSGDAKEDGRKLNWFVNFQNIPALSEYRSCFTVPGSTYKYITLDLSGAEIVIAASNSQDPLLIKSITEKFDLHSMLATKSYSIIYRCIKRPYKTSTPITPDGTVTITKKDDDLRSAHKPVLFGIMYMAGANRISELLDIPENIAKFVLEGIFQLLPEMKKYLYRTAKGALSKGFIIANKITKRRRYFSEEAIEDKAYKVEKEACNFPIQGTNADMIKMSLVAIDEYIRSNNLDAWIVNTVHDEISVIAHESIAAQVFKDVQSIMEENANKFLTNVTMSSSGGTNSYWTK